ncbi:hypothetical protein ES703_97250 [subsurface metagenome]
MKVKDSVLSRSRRVLIGRRHSTRWGRPGRSSGSELVGSTGLPLNIFVFAPLRVMASSTLSIRGASFPNRGLKMLGTRYGGRLLSLFRLYVVKNASHGTSSGVIWLDMTVQGSSFDNLGPGGGFSVDLYACGNEYLETVWICQLQSTHGMFYSGHEIPEPIT